jgi:hypothetical protein
MKFKKGEFKKGDLVVYRHPNDLLNGQIGVVLRDSEFFRTQIHFPNMVRFKTRYILNEALKCASK